MFSCCCGGGDDYVSSGEEVEDDDAVGLSHIGEAAYDVLRKKHNGFHHQLWNVTSGKVVGEVHQTPLEAFSIKTKDPPPQGHDDWFPDKMKEIIERTEIWCDVLSLGPPDGLFCTKFNEALKTLNARAFEEKPITIRMMFGNIVGMPVNCTVVIRKLTQGLSSNSNIRLWVGAWRKGVSWNHAKIIAVDGKYLHTGGHNLWDYHYLKHDPVHDLSLELQGRVTHDGHLFANQQWDFVEQMQSTLVGKVINQLPDALPMVLKSRVTVSEFPEGKATVFPPRYRKRLVSRYSGSTTTDDQVVPIISMGRYGTLTRTRPSDDAFLAMIDSAKTIIHMALQDLGPVCIPGTKITVPGCVWPKQTLSALGRVIWTKGVDVEIVLSNPGSIPGGLSPTEASYGNGWSCVDVAAEIIKTIRDQFPDAQDAELRTKVEENLRVCFLRQFRGNQWDDGETLGMHAKHFIVDDVCTYIGSQNLYICDLAEWGVVIDDEGTTKKIMKEYWAPLWEASYTGEDVNVQAVMDGLEIDRDGEDPNNLSEETKQQIEAAKRAGHDTSNLKAEGQVLKPHTQDYYYDNDDEEQAKP